MMENAGNRLLLPKKSLPVKNFGRPFAYFSSFQAVMLTPITLRTLARTS